MILHAFMCPHPPYSVHEIGKGSEAEIPATLHSFERMAESIAELQPDTIILTSPHATMYKDWFNVSGGPSAVGDFSRFRAKEVTFEQQYDTELVRVLDQMFEQDRFPAGTEYDREHLLDHGTMVPLYFINQKYKDYKLVRIGLSGLNLRMHYQLGQYIRKAADLLNRRIVFIASGDLSHCQKETGPYGYHPEGPEYDRKIMQTMGTASFEELFDYDPLFLQKAMECGHRSFVILAGALDRTDVKAEVWSHEDISGVGYGIVSFTIEESNPSRNCLEQYETKETEKQKKIAEQSDSYVRLARAAVNSWVAGREKIEIPEDLDPELLQKRAGVFVSLHEFNDLRGCIGTISPKYDNIAQEILHNALSACTHDPRFEAVEEEELPFLNITVDVLSEAERIKDIAALDVKKYGVICSLPDGRRGLLLPDLEGVDTPEMQVKIACRKGGIDPDDEDLILERFEVVRHV